MDLKHRIRFAACRAVFRYALIVLAACLPLACRAFDISYWVWERASPLSQAEIAGLRAQKVTVLYWNIGEISNAGADWKWKTAPAPPRQAVDGLTIIPVVRITSIGKSPFDPPSLGALVARLRPVAAGGALQIDFDCPDRLLGAYAQALKTIHAAVPKLTITALAGWSRRPEWGDVQAGVDGIFPMFYDLGPEPGPAQGGPVPLADVKTTADRIASWSGCKIPWMAGIPSFGRLSLYDVDGRWLGNIRQWGWDDVCFNICLISEKPTAPGMVLFQVRSDGIVSTTPVKKGQLIVARLPAREALAAASASAQKAGAQGVIYFRLPDGGDPSGWSLRQMAGLTAQPAPKLELREQTPGRLTLVNNSDTDLEPRLSSGDNIAGKNAATGMDRGYALEIDADAPIFREATPGDFWKVTGHANPDSKPALVAIPLATRLTFWFSHLRAGESLDCGLIQLAPNTTFKQIRWRVIQLGETWQPVK